MTAVIGVLNKQGIALAADSAVTVEDSNGKKIYNTANKIFTLSKFHPVSMMIYGSATFMLTPWEIIIKLYRKELNDSKFDTIIEYQEDFIKFLKNNKYFTTEEYQLEKLKSFIYYHLTNLIQSVSANLSDERPEDEFETEFIEIFKNELREIIHYHSDSKNEFCDFKEYSLDDFKSYIKDEIIAMCEDVFSDYKYIVVTDDLIELIIEKQYCILLATKDFFETKTGLVFSGYGDKEIYPSLVSIDITDVFDNRLRYYKNREIQISNNNNGAIIPFGQTDVIDTFLAGIAPDIENKNIENFKQTIDNYRSFISDNTKDLGEEMAERIKTLDTDEFTEQFYAEMLSVQKELHISPTIDTVSILSKEDLFEMAESLVYLTYLKRRISSDEESVGGPIDVAFISKDDGFIWIKRKQYFSQDLNKHLMSDYFNK